MKYPTATDRLSPKDLEAQKFLTSLDPVEFTAVIATMDSMREMQYAWTLVHLAALDTLTDQDAMAYYAQARNAILKAKAL